MWKQTTILEKRWNFSKWNFFVWNLHGLVKKKVFWIKERTLENWIQGSDEGQKLFMPIIARQKFIQKKEYVNCKHCHFLDNWIYQQVAVLKNARP